MTIEELEGRQLVVEGMLFATFLQMAHGGDFRTFGTSEWITFLDGAKSVALGRLESGSAPAKQAGIIHLDELLSEFSENLLPLFPKSD